MTTVDPRIARGHHDPYSPSQAPAAAQAPTVPTERLWRLGATRQAVNAYERLWARLTHDQQAEAASRWALRPDRQVAAEAADVDSLHSMSVPAILAWVRTQPDRDHATAIALAVEAGRDQPRPSLIDKLRA